ncbi:MAG TPA: tripartite tricarboxylate transporter substrate-binding protein [Burkholderiales bacterium]|nr:tripartite tricarboxylate transporter substrate-binding protein [Burkholderiales bacterium]
MKTLFTTLALAIALTTADVQAAQSDYPTRPVRLLVPFPPGGSNDIMARYFGQYLTERLGQSVVIDNRGGAEGIIATDIVAHSRPDGYTLLFVSAAHSVHGGTRKKLPYDALNSFAWIGKLGFGPSVVSVHPGVKVTTAKELIALGRANPGKLTLATSGGYALFASESFNYMSGMKMVTVVYKGGFPALMDVIGGQAQVNIGSLIQTLPFMGGANPRVRALATTGLKRAAAAPDLPTVAESGIPGFEANNWWTVAAPAGTPPAIINKLTTEMARYLKLPETLKRFEAEGVEADYLDPAGVRKMLPVEMAKWKKVAAAANIHINE